MLEALSIGLSGLNANNIGVDVTGNNLANLNTTGYKASSANFRDLIAQSLGAGNGSLQLGLGVAPATTIRRFSQGAIQSSNSSLDAAIQGDGFFMLQDSQSRTLYTRAGNFKFDAAGALQTINGEAVQGWSATGGVLNTSGPAAPILLPAGSSRVPNASTQFSVQANLSSSAAAGQTFSVTVPVYDSLGTQHSLNATFTNTAPGAWSYDVSIPSADVGGAATGSTAIANGAITFDSAGNLTSPTAANPITLAIPNLGDKAADLNLNWNLFDANGSSLVTQFDQASAVSHIDQDGNSAAQRTGVSIQDGGQIVVAYADGSQSVVGQLAIAAILNPESLAAAGGTNFALTGATSPPAVGTAGSGGRGQVLGSSIESSTVDLAHEFSNLIVYQRGYEAASKIITTADTLSRETINLIPAQ